MTQQPEVRKDIKGAVEVKPQADQVKMLENLVAMRKQQVQTTCDAAIQACSFEQVQSFDIKAHLRSEDTQALELIRGKIVQLAEQTMVRMDKIADDII